MMKIKIIIIAMCGCTIGLFSVIALAQQSTEEGIRAVKSKLFDAPYATYKLQAMVNGRGFQFCNTSGKQIKHTQLGCVKNKKNELFILSERELEIWENNLKSEDTEICSIWVSNHGFFPVDECKKGKLALIEVAFEDGLTWKLKP